MHKLSVVVPAYNEERHLPKTLEAIGKAAAVAGCPCELIVVDNDSRDGTRRVAESHGAKVAHEGVHNIATVRNTGAAMADGDVVVFIDADTLVPETLFREIASSMSSQKCFGGAVAVEYEPFDRKWMTIYLRGWKFWGKFFNMTQGAAQFCRKSVFERLHGFDPTIFVGEDIEFYWRLSKYARQHGGRLRFVEQPTVLTSSRRFDKMSLGRTLLLTHPIFIRLAWRRRSVWTDWYEKVVR